MKTKLFTECDGSTHWSTEEFASHLYCFTSPYTAMALGIFAISLILRSQITIEG